jgi:hypothetical protein
MDNPADQIWELRIHGVGDSPPESILPTAGDDTPPPPATPPAMKLVAGDDITGFYQYETLPPGADPRFLVEAFSWGQLTSGARAAIKDLRRAAWGLLLPFALMNFAIWARPKVHDGPGDKGSAFWLAGLVRVLALTSTISIILTAAGVGMDELAWQCQGRCSHAIKGLAWLSSAKLTVHGRLPLVGAVVPLLVLAVIVVVVSQTFQYEAVVPVASRPASARLVEPGPGHEATARPHPMQDNEFWRGRPLVAALRLPHVAVGLATIAHVLAASTWSWRRFDYDTPVNHVRRATVLTAEAVSWAALVVVILAVAAVLLVGSTTDRQREVKMARACGWAALILSGLLLVPAVVVAWLGHGPTVSVPINGPDGSPAALPGFEATLRFLYLVQFILLAVCFAVNVRAARAAARDRRATRRANGESDAPAPDDPVWRGWGTTLFAGAGWVVGSVFTAAVLLGGAWWLNENDDGTHLRARVSTTVQWAAIGFTLGAVIVVVVGVCAGLTWKKRRKTGYDEIVPSLLTDDTDHQRQAARLASSWRGTHLFDGYSALSFLGWLAVLFFVVLCLGAAVAVVNLARGFEGHTAWTPVRTPQTSVVGLTDPVRSKEHVHLHDVLSVLANAGGWIAVGFLLGVVLLLGVLYRTESARRTFGVLWDITTFWPRAAHPFGPPCYAERAVPQLITRVSALPERKLILAGHSQGGLIAAACLFQLTPARRRSIHLFTYGTQLTRYYGRAFPAFFGREARAQLAGCLPPKTSAEQPEPLWPAWTSLWRPTDPLGWPINGKADREDEAMKEKRSTRSAKDIEVTDPQDYAPTGGEVIDPKVRQHSGYPLSPEYVEQRKQAADLLDG